MLSNIYMKYFNIRKDILATLAYFNMFDYPLKKNEIFLFLGHCNDYREFEEALSGLLKDSAIYKMADFYSLQNDFKLAIRRFRGNEKAISMLRKAETAAAIISAFPFVRGVAVSGSLSKHFADDQSDIDFFIITQANRLWIARSLLHIFKKLTFIVHKQSYFCMNYFIDTEEPAIMEKNIYTAMEVATILPLRDNGIFDQFFKANHWAGVFFPNKYLHTSSAKKTGSSWIKSLTEKCLNNRFGVSLDNFLMRQTAKNWNAKTQSNKKDNKGMLMSMHVGKHFSKPNPEIFQKKILQSYENSLSEIFKRCELSVAK
jgi:hypothetical protein